MLRNVYVIASLLVAILISGCFSESPGGTGPDDGAADATIEMTTQLAYSPGTVTIRVGQRVRWRNTANFPHTATANPSLVPNPSSIQLPSGAQPFNSGDVQPGSSFTQVFTVAGTYRYVCLPHLNSGMVGTIIVTP